MKLFYIISSTVCLYTLPILAQNNFRNLNFETENITKSTPTDATVVIPFWEASTSVLYDGGSTGGQVVAISDSNNNLIPFTPLEGKFSVILFAGPDLPMYSTFIEQTGLVPSTAESILMDIGYPLGSSLAGAFTVTLGTQQIPMKPLQTFPGFIVFGGDVSAYAGQVEGLTITQFPPNPPNVPPSAIAVDNIIFSSNSIPEPAIWTLLLCGMGLFGASLCKQKQQRQDFAIQKIADTK